MMNLLLSALLASSASAAGPDAFETMVQAQLERLHIELGPNITGIRNPYPSSTDADCWDAPTPRLQAYGVYERERLIVAEKERTLESRRAVLRHMEELVNMSGSERVFTQDLRYDIAGLEKAIFESRAREEAAARFLVSGGHALRNAQGELLFLPQGPGDGLKARACAPIQPQRIEVR